MKDDEVSARAPRLGRRDLIKMGAGAGAGIVMGQMLNAPAASAQEAATRSTQAQRPAYRPEVWRNEQRYAGVKMETGSGWKNTSNRASGNGPMDKTTLRIVKFVNSFSESDLTGPLVNAFHNTMVDSIASLVSGFESEPARICARLARTTRCDLQSTVLGYGITTTPELAAYANTTMLRHADFNDHTSDMVGGILAIGEALHSTGTQVMIAIILAYQVYQALVTAGGSADGFDAGLYYLPTVAVTAGKLLNLNEDQLANALALALTMHIPLRVDRAGTLSMQKGCATADAVRCAVFAAVAAREGMTGPAQSFEGRDGLWEKITGPYRELRLPAIDQPGIALNGLIKRFPAEGYTQAMHEFIIPQVRAWTKAENIASIHVELTFSGWLEIADPPKWDPRNRETADHSMAYEVARALIDGEVWLDSFTPEKCMDPAVRGLMEKTTVSVNPDYAYHGQVRMTVRTKAGGELIKEIGEQDGISFGTPMTHDEIIAKFNRVFAFMHVTDEQRDRALAQWSNLRAVKDIAEPMKNLAKFGRPLPL